MTIEVEIEDDAWTRALPQAEATAARAARAALAAGGADAAATDVTILLTDDGVSGALNQQYRGKPGPTNVLSFPAPESARPHLGDLALTFGVCSREAGEQGKSLADHLSHLVAHGVLHLLGWDHQTDDEAEAMERLERDILAGLDIPDPYGP
ncbi:MAG: rRNA maturation RNase YbeY [Caulobacteraceae bacterium]|nr:rRNA maturation RNase YbeY [Caulobacteraceae bacterium]